MVKVLVEYTIKNGLPMNSMSGRDIDYSITIKVTLLVVPNPASNYISIGNLSCRADIDICIYNLSGGLILEKNFCYPYKIELSKLNPGMYILSIYQAKTKYNLIFVKQ